MVNKSKSINAEKKAKGKVAIEDMETVTGERLLTESDKKNILPISPINEDLESIGGGISYDDDNQINKRDYAWVRRNNSFFISAKPNVESVPSGLYDIESSMEMGLYLERRSVMTDELFQLPDDTINKVVDDINKFWNSREKYSEYNITYKRGILMFGPPGTGKSALIHLLTNQIIKDYNGIVLNMEDVDQFIPIVKNIRALEPDVPILAIIEDLDGFLGYNSIKRFLNLLDGNLQVDNIVYIATTNYLDRIEDRIKNRPSRFDRRYKVGYPDSETREYYLKRKLKDSDLEELGQEGLDKWVADTEGFSFSHLKDLIASHVVMGVPYKETIHQLKSMYEVEDIQESKGDSQKSKRKSK